MNIPTPTPHESFDRYSIRAQRALFREIPDPFDRMGAVRRTWRQHRGPTPEEELADRKFSPDRYQKQEDVCVFAEHETTDSQGQPRKYDLRKLARIVRYCNERALEHEAFAAIADRHTSNPGDPNPTEPRVMGYAGPYRLGLIGSRKPTWAIFTDEYRFPGEAEAFLQKNRRSVELWTDKRTGRMWFDPLTTCGADAPRLPLPSRYTVVRHAGAELERYTAAAGAPATAGLGSTHVPGHKAGPKPMSTPRLDTQSYEAGTGSPVATLGRDVTGKPTLEAYEAGCGAPTMPTSKDEYGNRPGGAISPVAQETSLWKSTPRPQGGIGYRRSGSPDVHDAMPAFDLKTQSIHPESMEHPAFKHPSFGGLGRVADQYDADLGAPTQEPNAGGPQMDGMNGQAPTLEQIVEAVMQLPPMQWAMQKMAEPEPGPGGMDQLSPSGSAAPPPGLPPSAPATPAPGGPPGAPPMGGPPEDDQLGDLDDLLGGEDDQPPAPGLPDADDPAREKEKNSMAYTAQNDRLELQKYQASHERLVREHGRTLERLQALEREATDAKRQSRFAKLRADHPAFPIDEDEIKPALYSLGGQMTDPEFDRHIGTMEKYAARFVQPVNLPRGEALRSEDSPEKAQYAAKVSREAVRLATAAVDAGQHMTWDEAYAKAAESVKQ